MKWFHNNLKYCKNLNNKFRQMSHFLGGRGKLFSIEKELDGKFQNFLT